MIGLIDVDGKLPNLALMKISAFYKAAGEKVEFVRPDTGRKTYEKIYAVRYSNALMMSAGTYRSIMRIASRLAAPVGILRKDFHQRSSA